MPGLLTSTAVVAVAEIGDKTQLLSLLLAARYRRPIPIILAILAATLANHALAAWLGAQIGGFIAGHWLRWLLAASFLLMAGWALFPDKLEGGVRWGTRLGVFTTALVAFFVAEIGDKTQVATIALAARYTDFAAVLTGTTLGMLCANVPAVLLGERVVRWCPLRAIRWLAAGLFALIGVAALLAPMP